MSLLPYGRRSGSFIKASADVVAGALVAWGNEDRVNRRTRGERKELPLGEALELLDPRDFNPDKAIVVQGPGPWTAFFDNHQHEYMAAAELFVLCQRLKTDTCFFFSDDDEGSTMRGSAQFYFHRFNGGVRERLVMVSKESGWVFQQTGEPLPFERLDAYAAAKKRDRLTPDLLKVYGEALGIPFWDPAAYGSNVHLLEWSNKPGEDSGPSLQKVAKIFGRPNLIMDRFGTRPPPPS